MACHSLGEYYIYSFFWKRYRQRDLLRPTVFFGQKVAIIKTKSATIVFFFFSSFPSSRSFFSPFLLFFVTMILELLGLKKRAFRPFFHTNGCKFR